MVERDCGTLFILNRLAPDFKEYLSVLVLI